MLYLYGHLVDVNMMQGVWAERYREFIGDRCLNIGCAGNSEKGDRWENLDMDPRTHPDILHQLGTGPMPVPADTFDTVLASHVLEHIPREGLIQVVYDIHRILKPGGYLIAITPYGSSDDAWENPHHRQFFTETTYAYFSCRLYETEGTAGYQAYEGHRYGDWVIRSQVLVPYPEFIGDPELDWKKRHLRNVIRELHVVMQKVVTR